MLACKVFFFYFFCFALGQLKDFVKRCKVPVLTKQVRQVLDKSEETAKVVEGRRRGATFNLADSRAVVSR